MTPSFRFYRKLVEVFGVDLRSLAALRVSVGLILICDLIFRSRELAAHYSDFGAFPRVAAIEDAYSRWLFSIHLFNGTWQAQGLLFLTAGFFALLLLIGYRTRLATTVSWLLLISLQNRNALILDSGDVFLRLILFWGMFLPWSDRFSVDQAFKLNSDGGVEQDGSPVRVSPATLAYVVQVLVLYWFSVLHKSSSVWQSEASAAAYALNFDQIVHPFGQYLRQFPKILQGLTRSVYWFEVLGPVLLIFPFFVGPVRTFAVASFFALHIGLALCMEIGLFSWIAMLATVGFLPPWFWEKILSRSSRRERQAIRFFYDDQCLFCTRAARLLESFVLLPTTVLCPASKDSSAKTKMMERGSWVVVDRNGKEHFGYDGFCVVIAASPWAWLLSPLLKSFPIGELGNRVYRYVADHRRVGCHIAERNLCAPKKNRGIGSRLLNVFISAAIVYMIFWNIAGLENFRFRIPERVRAFADITGLDQKWNMFAPTPPTINSWYVMPAVLANGEIVDFFNEGKEVSWQKPESIRSLFRNYRWRKYFEAIHNDKKYGVLRYFGAYACKRWNSAHALFASERMKSIEIFFVWEDIFLDERLRPRHRQLFYRHECSATPSTR